LLREGGWREQEVSVEVRVEWGWWRGEEREETALATRRDFKGTVCWLRSCVALREVGRKKTEGVLAHPVRCFSSASRAKFVRGRSGTNDGIELEVVSPLLADYEA